jgi:thiamine transport system permease protein
VIRISPPARRRLLLAALWLVPLGFLALFYFYPLVRILQTSFGRGEGGILSTILESWLSPMVRRVLGFTVWQAALSTLLTLVIGLPGAYLLARFDFRGKSTLQALFGIPFVMPTLVVAAAFYALLGPTGWVNLGLMELFELTSPPLRLVNSIYAILLAHVFYNTTIVLRMVGDFWSHLDPKLVMAARTLGASRWKAFRRITLPLLSPSIITAALLVFIFDFTSFGVILVLGGPRFATLEVEIYYQTISLFNLPLAATLSLLQLACTLGMTIIYTRLSARLSQPLTLRSGRHTQMKLSTWRSRLVAGLTVITLLTLLVAPLFALAVRSFTRIDLERGERGSPQRGFTLDYYQELTINRRSSLFYVAPTTAIGVSFTYATATVLLALFIGLPAAWALARDKYLILNRILDPVLMLPLGTSAVTMGLGFIIALNRPPLDLRASPLLIPIAHTLVAFPFVVRSLTPALRSIQPKLRKAAAMLGASPWQIVRFIDLPLVGRAILVAGTFAFAISLGEFGATALIARPEYPTIPLVIYRYLSQPGAINNGQALALSTILMVVAACGMLAIERLRIAEVGEF